MIDIRRWAARTVVLTGVAAAVAAGPVTSAQASVGQPGVTTNCGAITCSDYASREGTRQMLDLLNSPDSPAKLLSSTACTLGGGRLSPVCRFAKAAIRFGVAATRRTLEDAVHHHPPNGACFKTTYIRKTGIPTYVSTNNGTFCHDR